MAVFRLCGFVLTFLVAFGAIAQDNSEDLVRLGFFPPMDEDIVFRIQSVQEQSFRGNQRRAEWTHELHLRLTGEEPPDMMTGSYSIRAVRAVENVERDIAYLFARAIENETYPFKMLRLGAPVEIDWPRVKVRFAERLPGLTDPVTAAAIERLLPVFEPDGVGAVMRPLWVTSVAHLRPFRRDATWMVTEGLDLPAWFYVPGSNLETYGGREEGSEDLLFVWRIKPNPQSARDTLGPELATLAAQAGGLDVPEAEAVVAQAIADGLSVVEGGIVTYDPTPGLIRTVEFEARLGAGDLNRRVEIRIERLKPE